MMFVQRDERERRPLSERLRLCQDLQRRPSVCTVVDATKNVLHNLRRLSGNSWTSLLSVESNRNWHGLNQQKNPTLLAKPRKQN